MQNKENLNTVTVELGGRVFDLKLTHTVLKRISARTRLPMSRIDELMDRYDLMSVAMEEMLLRCDPTLEIEKICELLDELPIMAVGQLVNDAFSAAFPPPPKEDGENQSAEEAVPFDGTGTQV